MDDLQRSIAEGMKDPEFRSYWDDGHARDAILDTLVQARKNAGLTQTEVARRMGVRQPTVSKLEQEGSDPQVSTLQRYARALGLRLHVEVREP